MSAVRSKYILRVCNKLLIKLRLNGIDPTEATVFFGSQIEGMLLCTPNYGPRSNKTETSRLHQLKKDVWLMRGFYPGTAQMFKISVATIDETHAFGDSYQHYVKVSEPIVRLPTKKLERGLQHTSRFESSFTSEQINEQLQNRVEKEILSVDLQLDPMISSKTVFTPKCLSPKGMKLFRLDLKKD